MIYATAVATVYRAEANGRRYLTKRGAIEAHARKRMMREHDADSDSRMEDVALGGPGCYCAWCEDQSWKGRGPVPGTLFKRYVRFLMHLDRRMTRTAA